MRCPLIIILLLSYVSVTAQEREFITVNTLKEEDEQKITKAVFKYPEFLEGKLVKKDGSVVQAPLNYHRYFEQVFFIDPETRDTLALGNPEMFTVIKIGTDSFYFFEKGFPVLVTNHPGVNLAKKEVLALVGKEKKGLYGTYSGVSSANSNQTFYNAESQSTTWLRIDENAVFKFDNRYFLKDQFNNFFPANKKNFFELFFKKENELRSYLKNHKVNFKKEADLKSLVDFLNSRP